MFMSSGGTNRALLLVALALGYIVCHLATKNEKTLKTMGYAIGGSIIILSSLLILGNLFLEARACTNRLSGRSKPWMMRQQAPMMPMPSPQK